MAEPLNDLLPLEKNLSELLIRLKDSESDEAWQQVATTAQLIANGLRDKDGPSLCLIHAHCYFITSHSSVDNHTVLGQTSLIRTISALFSLALHGKAIPDPAYTAPILEILRVSANLCMDHGQMSAFPSTELST